MLFSKKEKFFWEEGRRNKKITSEEVIFLARREGFEPPAFWSVARRSIQLS